MKYFLLFYLLLSVLISPIYANQSGQKDDNYTNQISLEHTEGLLIEIEQLSDLPSVQNRCCKVCKKGKACGNSCIAKSKTCHKPPGCACDG